MPESARIIHINSKDNVAIALQPIWKGVVVTLNNGEEITALDDIPASHKIAVTNIKKDEHVIKYGESIGVTSEDLAAGRWVHVHNLKGYEEYDSGLWTASKKEK